MEKYIVGVAENMNRGYAQFQMIFNDGTKTDGKRGYDEAEWNEKVIQKSREKHLSRVEVLYDREDGRMVAIKFWDKDDCALVVTEDFDQPEFESTEEGQYRIVEIVLKTGDKLIGYRSRQKGSKDADYDVQFVIGRQK